jgi:hypothetical protein
MFDLQCVFWRLLNILAIAGVSTCAPMRISGHLSALLGQERITIQQVPDGRVAALTAIAACCCPQYRLRPTL